MISGPPALSRRSVQPGPPLCRLSSEIYGEGTKRAATGTAYLNAVVARLAIEINRGSTNVRCVKKWGPGVREREQTEKKEHPGKASPSQTIPDNFLSSHYDNEGLFSVIKSAYLLGISLRGRISFRDTGTSSGTNSLKAVWNFGSSMSQAKFASSPGI